MERLRTVQTAPGNSADAEVEIELTDEDLMAEDESPGDEFLLSEEDLEELAVERIEPEPSPRRAGGPPRVPPQRRSVMMAGHR